MTAPAVTARPTPDGFMLEDGYQSLIAFSADSGVAMWEKTVTPPGIDGGEAIDLTTMHNTTWRTSASRSLKTLTDSTFTAGYNPSMYDSIVALCNVQQSITNHFSDGSSLSYWGVMRSAIPADMSEGASPEMTVTITCTNRDPVTGAEEPPVYTAPDTGTA